MSRRLQALVASNDYFIKKQLVSNLLREGHDIWVASDGASALRLAREIAPDIVIADESLSGIGGRDLCRRLRPFPFSIPTPFTFLIAGEDGEGNPYGSVHFGIDVTINKADIAEFIRSRCFRNENLPRAVRCNLWADNAPASIPSIRLSA